MTAGEKDQHNFDGLKHVVMIRHLGVEAMNNFVGQLSEPSPVYSSLVGLSAEAKSDLIMLWCELFSGIIAEVADDQSVDDDSGTLEDLCTPIPGVDDTDVGDMIELIAGYNESMISAKEDRANHKAHLN